MEAITKQEIKPGYKKTPVGIIPEDWEVKRIGDLGDVVTGSTPKTTISEYYNGNELFVSPVDIQENTYVNQTEKTLTELGIKQGRLIPKNSILFVCIGSTIGKVSISGKNLITNQQINSVIPNKQTHFYYLFNILKQKAKSIKLLAANQAVPILNKSEFSKIRLPIPPLPEQKAIADCLSTWDKAIEKLSALIASKKEQKKGLMQQLLTGKKRLDGFTEEWKRISAGEVFKSITKKGFENKTLLSATQDRGIIPRDMLEGRVTMPTTGTKGYKLVEEGDFVISLRSFQGGLEYSYYRGLVSPAYTILKPKLPINDEFYKYYFKIHDFIGRLAIAVIGIRDGKQISYNDFCTVKIPYVSVEEQTAIAKILNKSDQEIDLLEKKLEAFKIQKKGLMQVLLTGEKRLV